MKYTITEGSREHPCTINVRFCRDCPAFQLDYWQPQDATVQTGWCKRMSYYMPLDNEYPHYVNVTTNSFCNEDEINDEEDYF